MHFLAGVTLAPVAAVGLSDQIRNAASLVAIALGLLTLFTNRRLVRLDADRGAMRAWSKKGTAQVALDTGLLLLTAAVVASIAPLDVAAWPPDPGRQGAVMRNLLLTATLGLLAVGSVQMWVVGTRVALQTRSSRRDRRNKRRSG